MKSHVSLTIVGALLAFFAHLPLFFQGSAYAQSDLSAATQEGQVSPPVSELTKAIHTQVMNLLGRHLKPEEFQAFVTATPNALEKPVPYLPDSLAPVAVGNASPGSLRLATKSIQIEVILADRYDARARTKLREIVMRALELDETRGDAVTFSSLGIKLDRPDSEVARDLAKAEAEARDYKARMDALTRERDDAKRETEGVKRDLALKSELGRSTPESSTPNAVNKSAPVPAPISFWKEHASLIVGGIIALLAIFASSAALRGAARNLSEAVKSVGAGLPALGEKLSESLVQTSAPLMLPSGDADRRGYDGLDGRANSSALTAGAPLLPMEAVGKRVLELHDELSGTVNEETEGLVIEYLSYLLEDDSLVGRAVASMELLGKDKANLLYNRLAGPHQQKVFAFLKTGVHTRPKGEVMLEAGEELKTRLFGAAFTSRANLDDGVIQKMVLLGLDDRVAVARSLQNDAMARFFLYIEPTKIAVLLGRLREKDSKCFERALSLVVKAPDVEAANHLDKDVLFAVETQVTKATADVQVPYLRMYKTIVETAEDDDLAEILAEGFSAANPRVERYVREAVVTFGTFFKLHGDIQEEIVVSFNNKDLAALVTPLKPELRNAIYAHVDERSRTLVGEEVERLSAKGLRQVNSLHKDMKKRVVARILQIKGSGPLSELLAPKVEGLPAGTPQNNQGGQAA